MRKLFPMLAVAVLFSGLALVSRAADDEKSAVKTITGEGQCAKCALMETDACQNAIVADEDGKKVTYYLAQNAVSKKFHPKVCKGPKKVTAKGSVKEEDGKMVLTATAIDLAK